jgi:NAD(P)-dependent dehydrogenase (short-subunit alcohol dehydrogenase family)
MILDGRVAVVTGGSRGIGQAICVALAQNGANVVVNYARNKVKAESTVAECQQTGVKAIAVQADVGLSNDVRRMFQSIAEAFGRVDILVNNAGVETLAPFLELEEAQWDYVYNTNVKGIYLCTQRAAQMMKETGGGVVINISSTTAQQVWTGYAHYCSSKAAVDMLTKCLAVELAPYAITVNAIAPGTVNTDMTQQDLNGEGILDVVIRRTPVKRLGNPEDIAKTVVFLCSGSGDWLTGEIITIDGGYRLSGDPLPGQ